MGLSAQSVGLEHPCAGGADRAATGERVDVTGEQAARELAELDADVLAVLAAVDADEPTGQGARILGKMVPDIR
ncbi:hypothetical protein [Nocardia salmonicida]|uniref:hypothetical protein n=1 Tax=Nocardia salmonicida TaxID=53431 RepID=UPI001041FE07|nr:hypothetical protein [Nocardia salmonicida]